MKLSFTPNKRQRKRRHGFMERMATKGGRAALSRRRAKGRASLTISDSARRFVGARISMKQSRRVKGLGRSKVKAAA